MVPERGKRVGGQLAGSSRAAGLTYKNERIAERQYNH